MTATDALPVPPAFSDDELPAFSGWLARSRAAQGLRPEVVDTKVLRLVQDLCVTSTDDKQPRMEIPGELAGLLSGRARAQLRAAGLRVSAGLG